MSMEYLQEIIIVIISHWIEVIFSCEEAALEVQMSVCHQVEIHLSYL